jgi:hypothetical protein
VDLEMHGAGDPQLAEPVDDNLGCNVSQ